MKPLDGILVVEFSQFLAGPSAGLRLADLGARVIKVERPFVGDGCRQIAIKNLHIGSDSLVFHTVNRNKESYAANLKDAGDLERVKKLLAKADIMTHNFRPGIMEKIGLDFESVKILNPSIIYGQLTGYGMEGPWARKPGQDLLIQSLSGLSFLTGNAGDGPTPMGLAVSDMLTGVHFTQGLLAALVRRGKTGAGGLVEVSLMESTLDFQFEVITTHFNDGGMLPKRAERGGAHAYLSAPYGVYATQDGFIAIAMGSMVDLSRVMDFTLPSAFEAPESWFEYRDAIMQLLQEEFSKQTTGYWLDLLQPANVWCSEVNTYADFLEHEGYKVLGMDTNVELSDGQMVRTTMCPIKIDGKRPVSTKGAPVLGEDSETIVQEFEL